MKYNFRMDPLLKRWLLPSARLALLIGLGFWGVGQLSYADLPTSGITGRAADFQLKVNSTQVARKYLLGPYDVVSIDVYGSPEYDQKDVTVQPDGRLTIFPLGPLEVNGLTLDELHDQLVEKYRYYLNDPQVSIKLERTKSFIVPVTGAVLRPGSVEINTNIQFSSNQTPNNEPSTQRHTPLLSNVLLAAGGVSYDADIEHIQIKNELDHSEMEVSLLKYLKENDYTQDVYLVAGDAVSVPRLASPAAVNPANYKLFQSASFAPREVPVKVVGYVRTPGLVKLDPTQSANLNSAISSAGGYLQDAAYVPRRVQISRVTEQNRLIQWWVDPRKEDPMLMPNDIVYVPLKEIPRAALAFDYVNRILQPFATFANGYNNWALIFNPTRYLGNSTVNASHVPYSVYTTPLQTTTTSK